MSTIYFASIVLSACLAGVIYLSYSVNFAFDPIRIRRMGQTMILLLSIAVIAIVHMCIEFAHILTR